MPSIGSSTNKSAGCHFDRAQNRQNSSFDNLFLSGFFGRTTFIRFCNRLRWSQNNYRHSNLYDGHKIRKTLSVKKAQTKTLKCPVHSLSILHPLTQLSQKSLPRKSFHLSRIKVEPQQKTGSKRPRATSSASSWFH